MNRKVLALIPARAGSQRLVGKNIKPLHGKPLIAWSITVALSTPGITDVVVTTDCDDIAAISKVFGAEVPFLRPAHLATPHASSIDVVIHGIESMSKLGKNYDYVLLLQPTSPLREARDIEAALSLIENGRVNGVVSVCECEHSPLWSNVLPDSNSLEDFIPEELNDVRSQDLPRYYRFNGAIYLYKIESLMKSRSLFLAPEVVALPMVQENSIDIDNELDFKLAQLILEQRIKQTDKSNEGVSC
ncbi:acylneuraminate cytidylyltransferase family protein [Shewanella eurypsychrophilus]|uniref:Acylneuraminate cytidylyltransferase family protein n=1 Tax=Shewanella eurypsychrophilus TaxID=2593656 RepID=A0ABX6VE49_9GAMM|nr:MULTISPECIES: acylneuraminate cytidylyltransferase family protein [Shewanella]QFU23535.1 acylneuraminate cytidylyltransferase family protein [Shewanella sp. YLB-09]QPG58761.1 acylneuraminate cytidylyltransferase family protein [Shewanella eurypsychrophilus]